MASTPAPRSKPVVPAERTPTTSSRLSLTEERDMLRKQVLELQRISSLGVLAGSIVHELNNALTPILNYAKLGLRTNDPEYRNKAFEKILEASNRATAIAGGVLGMVRPRADRREPADLARLIEDVVLITVKDLQKHRVQLDLKVDSRPQAVVSPAQIQQVLLNLVINARQAMPDGGRLTIRVGTDPDHKWGEIRMSDTGSGISPAHLRRIFEPFFTTKNPDNTGLGGTGLGLPVCRDIVESHRGRIRVESKVGQGATFTLRLPLHVEPPVAGMAVAAG